VSLDVARIARGMVEGKFFGEDGVGGGKMIRKTLVTFLRRMGGAVGD
jgi:hypothetical protein